MQEHKQEQSEAVCHFDVDFDGPPSKGIQLCPEEPDIPHEASKETKIEDYERDHEAEFLFGKDSRGCNVKLGILCKFLPASWLNTFAESWVFTHELTHGFYLHSQVQIRDGHKNEGNEET